MASPSQSLTTPAACITAIGEALDRLRATAPRVHLLTSPVAAERSANTLLALGCRPSLTANPDEIGQFVDASDALVVNLGMLDPVRASAIEPAIDAATLAGKPWLLDPVFADVSPARYLMCGTLLKRRPAAFKLNAIEASRFDRVPEGIVITTTGSIDTVRLGARQVRLANGHPLAASVTAMGCALGGVMAAFLAAVEDPFLAALAALATYGVAGDRAGERASGPGSFAVGFIDALAALDRPTLEDRIRFA